MRKLDKGLPVIASVRAYSPTLKKARPQKGRVEVRDPRWPDSVLVFDTETTDDETQRLKFGAYQYLRWTKGKLICVEEGLFHADDLPDLDPEGWEVLKAYAEAEKADVHPSRPPTLKLYSRREWLQKVLWLAGYKSRCLIVGFNLPFDLARLAVHAGDARGKFRGGFSFALWDYFDEEAEEWKENKFRPRIMVKHVDSRRAFIQFTKPSQLDREDQIPPGSKRPDKRFAFQGYFLDLRTLTSALTDRSHSLDSACEAFGITHKKDHVEQHGIITPEYIQYCRKDVRLSAQLLERCRTEFDTHPTDLRPWKAYSSASVAKAYLKTMGVTAPLEKAKGIPEELLGACMSAYFGGRAEARIRRVPVPVVYCDFLSMYPTVNALLDLWPAIIAEELDLVPATEEVQALLDSVSPEELFKPQFWSELNFFAEVLPEDEILPLRTQYQDGNESRNIGVNRVSSEIPLWYAGPDLVASALLAGRPPKVLRAYRLVVQGRQEGLEPIKLGGSIPIDPTEDDFFRKVIERRKTLHEVSEEERKRLDRFLKILANSGSYGIFAEVNREQAGAKKQEVRVIGAMQTFTQKVDRPEEPGPYFFPPFAALTTAAARLMLALLERTVTDLGGSYAFCDTDSMAIVASEAGGSVPCPGGPVRTYAGADAVLALSWEQVREIVRKFEALNPYNLPGSILEIEEDQNFLEGEQVEVSAFVISAKRYALFRELPDGSIEFLKDPSEHGLGHLRDPLGA